MSGNSSSSDLKRNREWLEDVEGYDGRLFEIQKKKIRLEHQLEENSIEELREILELLKTLAKQGSRWHQDKFHDLAFNSTTNCLRHCVQGIIGGSLQSVDEILNVDRSRHHEITISEASVRFLGRQPTKKELGCLGPRIAALYREKHGHAPPRYEQPVRGKKVLVNFYTTKDLDIIHKAVRDYLDEQKK